MNLKPRATTLIANYSWAGISTPLLNTASFFIDNGWEVFIFAPQADLAKFPFPSELKAQIIGPRRSREVFAFAREARVLRHFLAQSSIAFFYDHNSLHYLAGALFLNIKRVYYSLEFLEPDARKQHKWMARYKYNIRKTIERIGARCCDLVVSQDPHRCNYLKKDLGIDKLSYIYNSPRQAAPSLGSDYFRERFRIPARVSLILYTGTLSNDTLLDFVLCCAPLLPNEFAFVLHGWFTDPIQAEHATRIAEDHPESIYISTDLVSDSNKWKIYSGVDYVFIGFSDSTMNLRLALGSAGKLYDAMACGKPVIINASNSSWFVNCYGAGKEAKNCSEMLEALYNIRQSYEDYRRRCLASFREFDHDKSLRKCLSVILS